MMKHIRKHPVLCIFLLFPFLAAAAGLFLLPDTIPAHYTNGGLDRMGSKWELLICPAISLPFSLIVYKVASLSKDLSSPFSPETMERIAAFGAGFVSAVLGFVETAWVCDAYSVCVSPLALPFSLAFSGSRLIFAGLGLLFLLAGVALFRLPKEKLTAFEDPSLGHPARVFRTGCYSLMVLGFILFAGNLFITAETASLVFSLLVIILGGFAVMIAVVIASA